MKNDTITDSIIVTKKGPVLWIKFNRTKKSNAYDQSMLDKLHDVVHDFEKDNKKQILVLTGSSDRAFCAGADLKEIVKKSYKSALDLKSAKLFTTISNLKKISIASINGAAYGGGFELALSCDLRICSSNATFALPETNLGYIPAAGGTQRLSQIVGKGRAKEIILGGKVWDAEKALQVGIVSKIVPLSKLYSETQAWAEKIAARDPLAMRLAKQAIDLNTKDSSGHVVEKLSEALLYEIKNQKNGTKK